MKFPAVDITNSQWGFSATMPIIWDANSYLDGISRTERSYKNHLFCDSVGDVYEMVDFIRPTALWRRLFQFIPYVYTVRLVFEKKEETMSVEEFREYLMACLSATGNLKAQDYMMDQLRHGRTHRELMGGVR